MLDLCQLRILPEHIAVGKEPETQEGVRQGDNVNFVTDINIQQHHHSRQTDQLLVRSGRK